MDFIKYYFSKLKRTLDKIDIGEIKEVIRLLNDAYKTDNNIFILGNGGSASTASHFACDFGKQLDYRVYSLTDNVSYMTALGNDISYDSIFSEQLKNLVNRDDIVVAISASGNSPNVLKAVELAHKYGAITIGFTGFDGGKLKDLVNYSIHVPINQYGVVEDIHLILEHAICEYLKEARK